MKADAILRAGLDILVERGVQRDQPGGERTIPSVVAAFNALTGHTMTEQQGWLFMALVKVRRSQTGKPDADHYVDGANYFALAGEAALATGKESLPVDPAASAHAELQDLLAQRKAELAALEVDRIMEQIGQPSVYDVPDGTRATQRPCTGCDGTGNCAIDPTNWIHCPACNGEGLRYWIDCPDCSRTGMQPGSGGDSVAFCPKCRGKGELPVTGGDLGTPSRIDATATRWHDLQAMLRERQAREAAS